MSLFSNVLPIAAVLLCTASAVNARAQTGTPVQVDQPFELAAGELARSYLLDDSLGAIRTQTRQIRARQARIRDTAASRGLPLVESTLSIADERLSAPLKLRDRGLPPGMRIAPSTARRINTYFSGSVHSAESGPGSSDLTTGGVTVGADYSFDESLLVGMAITRMHGDHSSGNAVAAYLSLEPVERIFLDLSASSGSYASRATLVEPYTRAVASGQSRGYSVQLSHSQHLGDWSVSPFSRYEWIETEGQSLASPLWSVGQQSLSIFSIGGLITTSVGTPLGTVHPRLLLELQHESMIPGGVGLAPTRARQGLVGLGLTTRLSREVSAFAESRLRQEQGLTVSSEKRALVGLRMRF